MKSLSEDLQTTKTTLNEFVDVTKRVLEYIPNVVTSKLEVRGYTVFSSVTAGTTKYVRPIKNELFIFESQKFIQEYKVFLGIIKKLKTGKREINEQGFRTIDKVIYTIQQSIGVGLDLLVNSNSARKHVGNRFEELIRLLISELGVANKKVVLKIPYASDEVEKLYSCETDMVLSPFDKVKSGTKRLDPKEVVVSLKTTSKDRMGKIFVDKLLLEKFAHNKVKVIGIFLNDVQRKEDNNISYTFVSGLFMVYTEFLVQLEGVYFIDTPPKTLEPPYNKHIFPFSKFIVQDIWKLLS